MVCRSLILFFLFVSFIFPFRDCLTGEVIEYIDPDSCEDYEYFSITKLQCIPCDPEYYLQPKENKRACECEDNSLVISNVGEWPKCRPCPAEHRPSMDRRKCIPCLQSLASKSNDTACEFCAIDEIQDPVSIRIYPVSGSPPSATSGGGLPLLTIVKCN